MIIALDIDDVCADLVTAWLQLYNKQFDDHLTREDLVRWDIREFVKPEAKITIFGLLDHPNLYNMVKPIEGALEGVNKLRELGHKVIFVTHSTAGASGRKFEWLVINKFLPEDSIYGTDFVETASKEFIHADVIVDDKPSNVENFCRMSTNKCPRYGILFDRPHNQEFNWQRAMNWKEVISLVTLLSDGPIVTMYDYPLSTNEILDEFEAKSKIKAEFENLAREEQIKKSGYKDDQTKVLFNLIPPYPLFQLAKLFTVGARKYSDRNWEKGMPWHRPYNALFRHLLKWWVGEDVDPENGLNHMVAVMWNALVLVEFSMTHKEHDDRVKYDPEVLQKMLKNIDVLFPKED